MSCEKNRGAFVAHVAGAGSSAAQTFGGTVEAQTALEIIFETARNQAATNNAAQQQLATAKTKLLFTQMRSAGIMPPTHSKDGLPKADARFGYAVLYDTLDAIQKDKPLPALAAQIAQTTPGQRMIRATRQDDGLNRFRCGSCGRFVAQGGANHLCPNTATPDALQRALTRRLGIPASAYDTPTLARLIAHATADGIAMRHPITGEVVQSDLDALPLTITQGFVPQPWAGIATLVEVSGGRIAPVLNATGMTPVVASSGAIAGAAAASGTPLPTGTPMTSALVVPIMTGGSTYDKARFIGTEFRKHKGALVEANGGTYMVGDRSHSPSDWGYARHMGVAAPPPTTGGFAGIAVGRTLVAATEILRTGSYQQRLDGIVEVYDTDGGLLALYDPATHTAGDVNGTPNASAAQMAAIMIGSADRTTPLQAALVHDLESFQRGGLSAATPLAVSDSAYLAISDLIDRSGPFTLGATVTASQCPACGRFMGGDGCRALHATAPPSATATPIIATPVLRVPTPVAESVPVAPMESSPATVTMIPPVTVNVESPQVTVEPPQVTVNVEAPRITVEAQVAAPQITVAPPQITITAPVSAPTSPRMMPTADGGQMIMPAPDPHLMDALTRIVAVQEQLAAQLTGQPTPTSASATPPTPRSARPRRDRVVPAKSAMTEQEQIVSALRVPRPDAQLTALDPKLLPAGFTSVDEEIPEVNADYALNSAARQVMTRIINTRKAGLSMGRTNQTRSFGIYGPPGTGKNEIARQLAASMITVDAAGIERQGVHLEQVEFDKDMDLGALIGTTTLENGTTVARLGPIGLAAVQGSVICLNEVVRNPKALTAFQSMLEEGEIRLKTPEAGVVTIPIHPATTFVLTWNPGLDGDSDRPAGAPLARTVTMELPPPTTKEQVDRTMAFFAKAPPEYRPTPREVQAAVQFTGLIAEGIRKGDIQQRGRGARAIPGPREIAQFVLAGKTDGWAMALEQYRIYCDQNLEEKERDWKFMKEQFVTVFGSDGQAIDRQQAGAAPQRR